MPEFVGFAWKEHQLGCRVVESVWHSELGKAACSPRPIRSTIREARAGLVALPLGESGSPAIWWEQRPGSTMLIPETECLE